MTRPSQDQPSDFMPRDETALNDHAIALRDELNRACFCIDISTDRFWADVEAKLGGRVRAAALREGREHLVSMSPAFITRQDLMRMEAMVAAIEAVAGLQTYQESVLSTAPAIARNAFATRGVMMGYDFHLGDHGPRLIEVNTNAGGAFVNAILARSQKACCPEAALSVGLDADPDFDADIIEMFRAEWRAQSMAGDLQRIAIVDDHPTDQYLYPEFLLAQAQLETAGMAVEIVDPAALIFSGGRLQTRHGPVDLVYNRLTDFALADPRNAALSQAYVEGAVVLTPSPRHHAIYANKANLVRFSDPEGLLAIGLGADHVAALRGVLKTVLVDQAHAETLWQARKNLFFKPTSGHAGKRVYRGDKMTRGVWADILAASDYIAQAYCPPSERDVMLGDTPTPRKMDIRLYTYAGETLLIAARLYAGQTTNFRTLGGGFSPVIVVG